MNLLSGVADFFGLDIGTTAIRLVQLHGSGPIKALARYAYAPVDPKIILSDSKIEQQKLVAILKDLVSQSNVTTANVAVGIPSSKVFTTVVDIERLEPGELAKTIQYQADALIPTPLSDSKLDWAVIGDSPKDKTKVEVLLSSVTNEFVENRLDMLESIGLNVIAFEPDSLALYRAVVPPDLPNPQLILDVGYKSTDLVIAMNGAPRLTRSIPTGTEALVRAAMQNLSIDEKQAEQFVFKFGVSKDKLEGQVFQAIIGSVDLLMAEVDKSIKFFQTRYEGIKLDKAVVTGGGATLPEFPLYLANKFGFTVEIGNAWRNVSYASNRQNELLPLSNQFSVAVGLAERSA